MKGIFYLFSNRDITWGRGGGGAGNGTIRPFTLLLSKGNTICWGGLERVWGIVKMKSSD